MFTITHSNVTIMVNDLVKAIGFYESIGFKLSQRWGDYYAQLTVPGITIGLHPSKEKTNVSENISLGFTVDDFTACRNRLAEIGITFQDRKEEGGSFIHFKDPDGTPLYFIEPKK